MLNNIIIEEIDLNGDVSGGVGNSAYYAHVYTVLRIMVPVDQRVSNDAKVWRRRDSKVYDWVGSLSSPTN